MRSAMQAEEHRLLVADQGVELALRDPGARGDLKGAGFGKAAFRERGESGTMRTRVRGEASSETEEPGASEELPGRR